MSIVNKKRGATLLVALSAILVWTACDRAQQLEVRTFSLEHLRDHEALQLIDPYVYGDREGAPGMISTTTGAITVRETPDNLDRIRRVLTEYDTARPEVRLHFQLIEADGFTDSDARIATVEAELRKILQFGGYRLAGEAFVSATDGSGVSQRLQGTDDLYEIQGQLSWVGPETIRLEEVMLRSFTDGLRLATTVNIRPGQTLVLGSSPQEGSAATLLLTVRAESAAGSPNQ